MQINLDISAHHTNFLCLAVGGIYCEYEQGNNGKSNITHYNEETYSYYSGSITNTWDLKENKIFFTLITQLVICRKRNFTAKSDNIYDLTK